MSDFMLTDLQEQWARKRRRQGLGTKRLRELLMKQRGRCALSDVELRFDIGDRVPQKSGLGCHPLSPAVDHIDPGNPDGGLQIICYALNDLKGHMPSDCFIALTHTEPWKNLMNRWREQAERNAQDRAAFKRLIRPNAKPQKKLASIRTEWRQDQDS